MADPEFYDGWMKPVVNLIYTFYEPYNFREDQIFSFFTFSFKSQVIEYAEIISWIIFYKKRFKLPKWLTLIKKAKYFLKFCKFCDPQKNPRKYSTMSSHIDDACINNKYFMTTLCVFLTGNFPNMVSVLRQLDYEASIAFPNFQGPRLDLEGQKPGRINTKVWSSVI